MTLVTKQIVGSGAVILLLYLLGRKTPGRVTSEVTIDANVDSPSFGEVIPTDDAAAVDAAAREHARLEGLIQGSNDAIAAFDVAHPENQQMLDALGP